jgi:hypothetical protein
MVTMENIIDGFAKIEVQDMRVGRVDIPSALWVDLMRNPKWRDGVALHWVNAAVPIVDTNAPRRVGSLWGAEVYMGGNNVVVKPESWDDGIRWQRGVNDNLIRPLIVSETGIREQWEIGNLTIFVKSHCNPVGWAIGPEQTALEALRESLTEEEYRRYIRTGFLCVRGSSGKVYQIPRGQDGYGHVKVWERGKMVAEICSYLVDHKVPPTDRVIAFKAIIEADEQEMYQRGNVFNMAAQAA